ncbi:hypothetical protein Mal15_08310 [Stieleria maiorica]|uniref:Uncharacterized protein n=2 Tax=Stieleria maiorica TaxID=2795974 RepID=A0A5B9M6K1_9BACT|nr:hypothetical protein Mal15_08310 [Stieleria maiorica]
MIFSRAGSVEMDSEARIRTRQSLHQINNDLSIASMTIELISIKLQRGGDHPLQDDLLQSCNAALDAVKRAGKTANQTLHDLR